MSELPQGWCLSSLNELSLLINGDRGKNYPSKSMFVDSGIPFINAGHLVDGSVDSTCMNYITEEHFKILGGGKIQPNDLLYCLRGSLGKTAIVTDLKQGAIASSLVIIRPLERVSPKYLYYFLVSPLGRNEILKYDNGSAQPNLSAANVGNYCLPLPPFNEQRRIVATLEKLLAKCEACKQRLDKIPGILKRFRQSILATACSGHLTADWREQNPDVEPASELLKKIEADKIGQRQGKVSNGIEDPFNLPKAWKWVRLFDICRSITDGDHLPPPKSESGVPFLTISNITTGRLDFNEIRYVPEDYYGKIDETRKPYKGDILYTAVGATYGIPVLVDTERRFCFQRHIAILKPSLLISNQYLLYILKSDLVYGQATNAITGTAQPTVPLSGLRPIKVPLPPLAEQKEIVQRVENLFQLADQIEQRYQKAKAYVDKLPQSILAKAFRGELVPQDPNDEPASVLLERIREERAALQGKETRSKKPRKQSQKMRKTTESEQLDFPGME